MIHMKIQRKNNKTRLIERDATAPLWYVKWVGDRAVDGGLCDSRAVVVLSMAALAP